MNIEKRNNYQMTILNLRIVWFALLMSLFLMGYALFYKLGQTGQTVINNNPLYIYTGVGLGLILAGAAIFIPKVKLDKELIKLHQKLESQENASVSMHELISVYMPSFTLRLSLFESVSVIGFVLGNFRGDFQLFYPFVSLSLIAYFYNFPTEEKVKRILLKDLQYSKPISVTEKFQEEIKIEKNEIADSRTNDKLVLIPLAYMFIPLIFLNGLESYSDSQIDVISFHTIGLGINITLLFLVLFFIYKFKSKIPFQLKHKCLLGILLPFGFFLGLIGYVPPISYFNQLGDESPLMNFSTTVLTDGGQREEDKARFGVCYKLKHPEISESTFGQGDICEGKSPGVGQKKFLVTYREGNFGQRWAVKYDVLD